MLKSEVIVTHIDRPFAEVYAFLVEPANFLQWAANLGSEMTLLGDREYEVEVSTGRIAIQFSEPNDYGVLDYVARKLDAETGFTNQVRLYPNGDGSDLAYTMWQRAGVSDEQYASDQVWLKSDLSRLKTLLESRPRK